MGKIGILPKSTVIAIAGALFASILAAQEPLQLNVPYHCPDGIWRLTRCRRRTPSRTRRKKRRTLDLPITSEKKSATIACVDAERAHEYAIQKNANQILLKNQDNTNPFSPQLKPDGSLFADGTVQVNGRVIVGTTEDPQNPFIFAPKVAHCPVGTLVANH
jgi:hypothetical protein